MKRVILFTLFLIMINILFLNAENNDEWGAWFKKNVENSLENPIIPEDKGINQEKWKNNKDELIANYKKYLQRNDNSAQGQRTDRGKRGLIISFYYYDDSDPEIGKIIDFFIYVVENEKNDRIMKNAIINLKTIALNGNASAINYISQQTDNTDLSHKKKLLFNLANITIHKDEASLTYLMDLIKKAQDVETTDLKFKSPDESTILSFLTNEFFVQRYIKGLDYEYALPLQKQMLFSRSKGTQSFAALMYLHHTNKAEMRRIYRDCWAKVRDKSTPRPEFLDALYGLQALYSLSQRNIGKYKIKFGKIGRYFSQFATFVKVPEKNEFQLKASKKEKRLSDEMKVYFARRIRL